MNKTSVPVQFWRRSFLYIYTPLQQRIYALLLDAHCNAVNAFGVTDDVTMEGPLSGSIRLINADNCLDGETDGLLKWTRHLERGLGHSTPESFDHTHPCGVHRGNQAGQQPDQKCTGQNRT